MDTSKPLQGKTILVIEEDYGNRTALTVQLKNTGAEVLAVADLKHAREHLAQGVALPDVILLGDVSRGRLDKETSFCKEIKYPAHTHTKRIPLVVVSGLGITPDRNLEEFRQAGADAVFSKPYAFTELLECLTQLTAATPDPQLAPEREHLGAAVSPEALEPHPAR